MNDELLDGPVVQALVVAVHKASSYCFMRNYGPVQEPIEVCLSPKALQALGPSINRLDGGKVGGYEIRLHELPPDGGGDVEIVMLYGNDEGGVVVGEFLSE